MNNDDITKNEEYRQSILLSAISNVEDLFVDLYTYRKTYLPESDGHEEKNLILSLTNMEISLIELKKYLKCEDEIEKSKNFILNLKDL